MNPDFIFSFASSFSLEAFVFVKLFSTPQISSNRGEFHSWIRRIEAPNVPKANGKWSKLTPCSRARYSWRGIMNMHYKHYNVVADKKSVTCSSRGVRKESKYTICWLNTKTTITPLLPRASNNKERVCDISQGHSRHNENSSSAEKLHLAPAFLGILI